MAKDADVSSTRHVAWLDQIFSTLAWFFGFWPTFAWMRSDPWCKSTAPMFQSLQQMPGLTYRSTGTSHLHYGFAHAAPLLIDRYARSIVWQKLYVNENY